MSTAQSSFIGGMKKDFSPLISSNDTLTDALNATIITFNGNEYMLQQDMGNGRIETAYLPKGYVPVGIAEHGGIIYVASYNPLTQRSQIGSFPSPERNIASDENGSNKGQTFSTTDFVEDDKVVTLSLTKVFPMDDIIRPGDKFYFYLNQPVQEDLNYLQGYNNQNYLPLKITPGIISSDGEFLSILDSIVEDDDQLYWADPKDNSSTVNESIYLETYNSKIAGNLALSGELECINSISVTVNTGKVTVGTDQEQYQFQINMSVDYSTLASIVNFRGYKVELSTDSESKYIILDRWDTDTNSSSKTAHYTNNFSRTRYTWTNVDTPTSSDAIYNPGVATYLYQVPTSQFELDSNLTITVTPLMTYGELTEYSQELVIDTSKIGSGEFNITSYKFMHNIADGLTQLYFNIESYPLVNETINSVTLNFYSYSKWNELAGSPYAGNYSTIINTINKSDLLVYSTQIPKQNSYNGIRTINIQSDFLPSKDEYIIEMIINKSTTTYTDNGNGTSTESQQYQYFGLLTTEMFNAEYYDDTYDTENFSTFTQDAVNAKLSLINSEPNRTMIRSNMPGSIITEDSTTTSITKTSSATMTVTDTYKLSSNISISNDQNYVFDTVSLGDSKIVVRKSNNAAQTATYPENNILVITNSKTENIPGTMNPTAVTLVYELTSDIDMKLYSSINRNLYMPEDSSNAGKLVIGYYDGDRGNRGYTFFFTSSSFRCNTDKSQDDDNGDQPNQSTRGSNDENLGYRATIRNPAPNGLTGALHMMCSQIFKSMQNLLGTQFIYPFLSSDNGGTLISNSGDLTRVSARVTTGTGTYYIMKINNNDQICFLLPSNWIAQGSGVMTYDKMRAAFEKILVYNGVSNTDQTINPYKLTSYTSNPYTIAYGIVTRISQLDDEENLVYRNGNTIYYPNNANYILDWVNKISSDATVAIPVLNIPEFPFEVNKPETISVAITIDDFTDYERLLSSSSSSQYMFWNGSSYTSVISNGSINNVNDNTLLFYKNGKVYIQQGSKPSGFSNEAWDFFNSIQYDYTNKTLTYNGSVNKSDLTSGGSTNGPYFYLQGEGDTSTTLYLKEFGGYVEDGGFFSLL